MDEVENHIMFINVKGEYNEIIHWLISNIDDCPRQTGKEYFNRPKPYHFSAISQFARFKSNKDLWRLEIQGNQQKKTVSISETVDPKLITKFAILWT